MSNTSKRGLGSDNMSDEEKHRIRSAGGSASPQNFANNPEFASKVASRSKGGRSGRRKNQDNEE